MKNKSIFFDFDGVILDSNHIKGEAFYLVFLKFGKEIADFAKHFHENNLSLPRSEKILLLIEKFKLKTTYNELLISLNNTTFGLLSNASLIDGVLEFINKVKISYDLYILSLAPQNELEKLCEIKNLTKYFKEIYGYPVVKKTILLEFQKKYQKVFFIGDSISDYLSTLETDVKFIGKKSADIFPKSVKTIETFKEDFIQI